jgi:hypothetical protein
MNKLIGGIITGIITFLVCLLLLSSASYDYGKAVGEGINYSPDRLLLAAIFFLLLAILVVLAALFWLTLQNFIAQAGKTIKEQDQKEKPPKI